MNRKQSSALMQRACRTIPGGVNSPVRAFKGVGGDPVFFDHADGPYLYDVDDNQYIDYIGSWGPMILGHNHTPTIAAVQQQAAKALGFGAPTEAEIELAETIVQRLPSMQQIRMVNSGTEATMSAIRLARGFTGRDLILKFTGCYHGHSDSLLVKAGSGVLTLGLPNSPGVPAELAARTLSLPFNNLDAVAQVFEQYPGEIACIIVEPVAGNMGCIPPKSGYLQGLRDIAHKDGALIIFDEVMTGFRVSPGGAQTLYDIEPDLTTLGKIVGGGLPVGAFGGREEIMQYIAPAGPIYQAGTLSGNPLAMAAGLSTLKHLTTQAYEDIATATDALVDGLVARAASAGLQVCENRVCGMFSLFFGIDEAAEYDDVAASNIDQFNAFFHAMLDQGVYLAPSAFEAGFISATHTSEVIQTTLDAAEVAFSNLIAT
jgi:glutamate-1-semialdehyde 2,1-aminomutase